MRCVRYDAEKRQEVKEEWLKKTPLWSILFEEVLSDTGAKVLVCKPCATARCLSEANLDKRFTMAGMNEFHAAAARENARVVCF